LRFAAICGKVEEQLRGCDELLSIDEVNELLDEVAEELPGEVFRDLNGGVSLLPDTKLSEYSLAGDLYTLGEYCRNQMGRYINIYYGSICAVYPGATREQMRARLKELLAHELTHHLESLAGERDLEVQDAIDLHEYKRRRGAD